MAYISIADDQEDRLGESDNESLIISTKLSPDGKNKAIVYAGHEIGRAKWSFVKVAVQPSKKPFDSTEKFNYVFHIESESEVTPIWDGNSNLIILYTFNPATSSKSPAPFMQTFSPETGVSFKYIENKIE